MFNRLRHPLLDGDESVVTGRVSGHEFRLYHKVIRSGTWSADHDAGHEGGDEGLIVTVGPVPLVFRDRWLGLQTAFIGWVEPTADGCVVRGYFRPGISSIVIAILFLNLLLAPTLGEFGWLNWQIGLMDLIAGVIMYWASAVVMQVDLDGSEMLRFIDRVVGHAVVRGGRRGRWANRNQRRTGHAN